MQKHIFTFLFSLVVFISAQAQSKSNPQLVKLYQNYISVKSALASDDAQKTSMAANEFLKTASTINSKLINEKNLLSIKADAKYISQSKNIEAQRKSFYKLSDVMIDLAKENKLSDKTIFVQYCPMAKGSWMSNEKQIVNPYYGKSMLDCGSVKSQIK